MIKRFLLITVLLLCMKSSAAQTVDDTYWTGKGDGVTMDTWALNGRYLRHFEFPVLVYSVAPDALWAGILSDLLSYLSLYIPIEQTLEFGAATLVVQFNSADIVQGSRGAGRLSPERTSDGWVMRGEVLIDYNEVTQTHCPLLLHELLHALGIRVHSPNSEDIMSSTLNWQGACALSQRDQNTLLELYSRPALRPDVCRFDHAAFCGYNAGN